MDKKIKVAVMGATGAVGQVFMWMLADHPWFELTYATASASRVGLEYASTVHWVMPFEMPRNIRDVQVKEFNMEAMKEAGVKIVFSALPAEVAREAEPQLRDNGFYVFSNAASMRYESNVPILIPETNVEQLDLIKDQGYPEKGFVVTNANCVTTGLAMALAPLRKYGIKNIMVHSYQSVSGAGYPGLSSFDITDNCIPFIKGEEEKVEKEIKKILSINPEVYC
ncbi:MAG: aspartate-semialdehyde dehydrogenase, partial [Sphaerochaeta sp.]